MTFLVTWWNITKILHDPMKTSFSSDGEWWADPAMAPDIIWQDPHRLQKVLQLRGMHRSFDILARRKWSGNPLENQPNMEGKPSENPTHTFCHQTMLEYQRVYQQIKQDFDPWWLTLKKVLKMSISKMYVSFSHELLNKTRTNYIECI